MTDPKDDGYVVGDVYPVGPYPNEFGIQRGSVLDMPARPGDALTLAMPLLRTQNVFQSMKRRRL